MTSKFPETEEYSGLHELLEDWIGYEDYLEDVDEGVFEMGHYELFFDVTQDILFNPEKDMSGTYLTLVKHKKVL
jgi:hypothetical protein